MARAASAGAHGQWVPSVLCQLPTIHAARAAAALNVLAHSAPRTEPGNLHTVRAVIDMPTQRAYSAI